MGRSRMRAGALSPAIFLFLTFGSSLAGAAEPTLPELLALAPKLASGENQGFENFLVNGQIRVGEGLHVGFRAVYKAPDRFALTLVDTQDGTPLLHGADGQLLFYDPVHPAVLCSQDNKLRLVLSSTDESFNFGVGWFKDKEKQDSFLIDIHSLVGRMFDASQLEQLGPGRFRLTQTTRKESRIVSEIDTAQACPYTRVEIFSKEGWEAKSGGDITLDAQANLPEDEIARWFFFPEKAELSKHLNVLEFSGSQLNHLQGMVLMMRTLFVRVAALVPEQRDKLKLPGLLRVDWEAVKKNDTQYSAVLQELIAPPQP